MRDIPLDRRRGRELWYHYPLPLLHMRADAKKKTLDAIKRLEGLTAKLHQLVDDDAYCTKILEIALAMQGHLKHIQGHVLESHLYTCAGRKLSSSSEKNAFIAELVQVIGLSKR